MILEAFAAALVCIDPGHGTLARVGAQREPIGPGSSTLKIKDPGGAPGEAGVALDIALRTRTLLAARGVRVAMTRTRSGYAGGNVERAEFCNARNASLMLRIHADGSTNRSLRGVHTLYPALRRGWTDDIYAKSVRAARLLQTAVVHSTGAPNLGLQRRSDLTGLQLGRRPGRARGDGVPLQPRRGPTPPFSGLSSPHCTGPRGRSGLGRGVSGKSGLT